MADNRHLFSEEEFAGLVKIAFSHGKRHIAWYDIGAKRKVDYDLIQEQTKCFSFALVNLDKIIFVKENEDYAPETWAEKAINRKKYLIGIDSPEKVPQSVNTGYAIAPIYSIIAYAENKEKGAIFFYNKKAFVNESAKEFVESKGFSYYPAEKLYELEELGGKAARQES